MMQRDGVHHRDRQAPQAKQITTHIRVICPKCLLLGSKRINALRLRGLDGFAILIGEIDREDRFARVVQQAAREGLIHNFQIGLFQLRDALGGGGGGETVIPQCGKRKAIGLD